MPAVLCPQLGQCIPGTGNTHNGAEHAATLRKAEMRSLLPGLNAQMSIRVFVFTLARYIFHGLALQLFPLMLRYNPQTLLMIQMLHLTLTQVVRCG